MPGKYDEYLSILLNAIQKKSYIGNSSSYINISHS